MPTCSRPEFRENKLGWYACHRQHVNKFTRGQAKVVILGDSLVAGLARYPAVWDLHLKPLNTINCGIGGDRIQHALWRATHLSLPESVRVVVLLCGTNNLAHDLPSDIADGVISCGTRLLENHPNLHISS